ncbi:copper uptake system-associated protein, partial [Marivita sp.]|uniref:copper uptake system-associated protein n=1 Tax=Marivita sp. TaxID=2003365 RepID=UPI0026236148
MAGSREPLKNLLLEEDGLANWYGQRPFDIDMQHARLATECALARLRDDERIPATLVFDRAGEIAVEFWVEPREGSTGGHEGYDHGGLAPASHAGDVAAVQLALGEVLGPDAAFGAMALEGDAAVVAWRAGDEAGRAFLREEANGWRVILLSGESLRFAATFRVLGLSPRRGSALQEAVALAEADLGYARQAEFDGFVGTLLVAGH